MKIKNGYAIQGDCLEVMDAMIAKGVQFDAIITDPPYGTTACGWDSIIPFDAMWERLNKLIKNGGAIVLFGSEPFSSALRMSNIKSFKYDWIWDKMRISNPQLAKYQPLKNFENISVFSKNTHKYYPQGLQKIENKKPKKGEGGTGTNMGNEQLGHISRRMDYVQEFTNYPKSIIQFSKGGGRLHPTQKPVELIEYLIKTYTQEGEMILDFTAGSFTTAVAAENTNRKWICIEKDENYFNIGIERISKL